MKKLSIFVFLMVGLAFVSCETSELDILDDPNNVTIDKADLNRFLTQIQLDFANFMRQIGNNDAEVTRIHYMSGRAYLTAYPPVFLDGEWELAYGSMFSDMAAAETLALETGNNKHLGIMKILKGYTLTVLVDNFGDVPFSQATNPVEFPAPVADPGASVYAGAIALIDEGIALLNEDGEALENDFYYNNDYTKWRKLGNSVKMAAYLNTGDLASFNAIAGSPGNYISSNDDDFQFQYGNNQTNPDTRHPAYSVDYQATGAGDYRSNWLMNEMVETGDPRLRYYFYRQSGCTPGASCNPSGNQTTLTCSVAPRPLHFPPDMIFCSVEDGYWGRDHGNEEGIPPDGLLRTVVGVYPAGGKFDGDEFAGVSLGYGGGGAGIQPIMLAAWTDLMKAEAALASNNSSAASSAISSSLQKHIAKVQTFISVDPTADGNFAPSSSEVTAFIGSITSAFNAASTEGKWELLANQQFVAHYGNGIDSYNFYRRTGYPKFVQYNIEPSPGAFIRSFFYPSSEANVNANITQKPNVAMQVFWDTNPASPGFPAAN